MYFLIKTYYKHYYLVGVYEFFDVERGSFIPPKPQALESAKLGFRFHLCHILAW